jgi:hypothetical protein
MEASEWYQLVWGELDRRDHSYGAFGEEKGDERRPLLYKLLS